MDKAIRIGTGIRNSSGIGRGGISVGSMAVKLAEENVYNMKTKRTLLIGTGEVSTLVAKSLEAEGICIRRDQQDAGQVQGVLRGRWVAAR